MAEDLWSPLRTERRAKAAPLAVRVRPRTIDEIVGQRHCLGEGALLRRLIEQDALQSMIVAGPPGTGKTTLAEAIAARTDAAVDRAHGATTGVKELREKIESAARRLGESSQRTLLFVDEIHRLARNQQDALLEGVEAGSVILFGATTENPTWAVAPALLSRSVVFRFQPLDEADIALVLRRALTHPDGVGIATLILDDDACAHFARVCDGDVRRALSALETAANAVRADTEPRVTLALARAALDGKVPVFDRDGDEHYDLASALIKSMRGSDPDAAVYWLARMLVSGEDPRFICRRLAIFASEDIGNADPRALQTAVACWQAVERVGMPEAQLILSQCVTFLAVAAKSNAAACAIWDAMSDARDGRTVPVPFTIVDQTKRRAVRTADDGTPLAADAGRYEYPHDRADGIGTQEYLGVSKLYYKPTDRGLEAAISEHLAKVRAIRALARNEAGEAS
ncbi:MAG: replication-associated recombination protein A [Limnohabitans sp.]|nr:replication-associated recombination protein A [Limnohabitans sp.]